MRRAPAKPVRACTLRKWCPLSHVTFEAPLRTSHSTLHTSHCTLPTSHSTLHASQSTLHTSHLKLHSPHFTLLTSHYLFHILLLLPLPPLLLLLLRNLHAPCASQASACVLCAKLLQCCCPRCNANTFLTLHIALFTPHTPHFTLALHLNSSHLSSSHLIPCLPICQLISS